MRKKNKTEKKGRIMWAFIYIFAFIAAFGGSIAFKMKHDPFGGEFKVNWNDSVGKAYTDIAYGEGEANQFDIYVPADDSRSSYGLVVYLHAGGFTSGDKSGDAEMLQWLCSKGYVTAGINYTLASNDNPDANVYTQSIEIKESIPYVIAEATKLGFPIDEMAIAGGSAGRCLALLYAYRDAETSTVPIKMVFGAVGPSSFYPEDWKCYGFDIGSEESDAAARIMFGTMAGKELLSDFGTPEYDEEIKDISALLWVSKNSPPTLLAYGKYDKVQPYEGSQRLLKALEDNQVPHDYYLCEHSGHGLQNDNKVYGEYTRKILEYLDTYMPIK